MEKSKVLIIYTGGTIGMVESPENGALTAFDFNHLSEQIPELERINANLETVSLKKPIDSSDMNPEIWREIAQHIVENYADFNGFVILHGTDTMAYTASALSFMLQGLIKPIILTGSQLPIGKIRTDGKENIITSIEIAAQRDKNGQSLIQEVAIFFEDYLYRGNRTTKVSANAFEAFLSPNYTELAKAGIEIKYNPTVAFRSTLPELKFYPKMEKSVGLIKIFPGITASVYKSLFDIEKVRAVILESYGAGNVPDNEEFLNMIKNYIHAGGIVVNITQCFSGRVSHGMYANSTMLEKAGVISGGDLTTESAITKLMHLLGNYDKIDTIKELVQKSLVGELED